MNYDIEWTAGAIEAVLRRRAEDADDPEVPFREVLRSLNARGDVDRTPEWVAAAGIGILVAGQRARVRVWKRDQDRPDEVLLQTSRPPVGTSRGAGDGEDP